MKIIILSSLLIFAVICHGAPAQQAPKYVINLDLPPEQRWTQVIQDNADKFGPILAFMDKIIPPSVQKWLAPILGDLDKYLPAPYADELRGCALADPSIELGKFVALNLIYDLTAFCTSIVSENNEGSIYHVRNLDYDIPGLRNITIQVDFQKNNQTMYKGTTFAGYIGLLTGLRPNGWSVTVNERDAPNSTIWDNIAAFMEGGQSIGFFLRSTLDNTPDFQTALGLLQRTPLIAPVYLITAGVNSGEAAIITRDRMDPNDVWFTLPRATPSLWFLAQTNDDHWKPPNDKRRGTANRLMEQYSPTSITLDDMYKVVSTPPVLNDGTKYTVKMCPATGLLETYIRWDDPTN